MTWYYKYLPYFVLERMLNSQDPDNTETLILKGYEMKKYKICLIKIHPGLWIGANKKDLLEGEKRKLEKRLQKVTNELEGLNTCHLTR